MMKNKFKCVLLALVMVFTFFTAGCKQTSEQNQVTITSAVEVLNSVWDTFPEEERFPAMGGSFESPVDNAAGEFDISDTENLTYMLYVPADSVSDIEEAASLVHAMNSNTFTGAAFHISADSDTDAFVAAMKENILNTQWMCGIPEKMMIYTINDTYVISVFGSADILENFKAGLTEVYGENAILAVEENIA